jgi:hypothetical protein
MESLANSLELNNMQDFARFRADPAERGAIHIPSLLHCPVLDTPVQQRTILTAPDVANKPYSAVFAAP